MLTLALAAVDQAAAAEPAKETIELKSERIGVLGLPLAESETPVYRIVLTAGVGANGEGSGALVCDVTEPPAYDRFGFVMAVSPAREIKLDCALKLVKTTTKVFTVRIGGVGGNEYREQREDWNLYTITGSKIFSKPGDRVWRWSKGKRLAVPVLEVKATGRESQVFNLVLGAPTTFIAGEFLARSKPPVDLVLP
jgi:hypothetical protein